MKLNRPSIAGLLMAALLLLTNIHPAQAQQQICFAPKESQYCIEGRLAEFWQGNGGLPVFGFPIGPQTTGQIEGNQVTFQLFQRNRLELHPENAWPNDVLLGRLGADAFGSQKWQDWPFPNERREHFFDQTGHNIDARFWGYYISRCIDLDGNGHCSFNESIALFGLPLTEPMLEGQLPVQWFERAKFEYHSENAGTQYDVLLGLLGAQQLTPVMPSHYDYHWTVGQDVHFESRISGERFEIVSDFTGIWYRYEKNSLRTLMLAPSGSDITDGITVFYDHTTFSTNIHVAEWRLIQ